MSPDDRLDSVFRAARETPPDTTRAQFAFETRVAARVREERRSSWSAWAWRLSPIFAAVAVASAVWCHSIMGLEADADTLLDAVRGSREVSMLSWWPEGEP